MLTAWKTTPRFAPLLITLFTLTFSASTPAASTQDAALIQAMTKALQPTPTQTPAPIPTIVQPQTSSQPQTQSTDRKGSQSNVSAGQMMQAAMAGMGCIMGLKAAQDAEDESTKMMMMMMAMQQCGQAAQSANSSNQNKEGAQQISNSNDPTKQPTLSSNNNTSTPTSQSPDLSSLLGSTDNSSTPTPTASNEIPITPVKIPTSTDTNGPKNFLGIPSGLTTPPPIDKTSLTFKEDSKGGEPIQNIPTGMGTTVTSGVRGLSAEEAKKVAAEEAQATSLRSIQKGESGAAGGEGENSGGGNTKSGNDPFEGMLASLMGGGQAPDAASRSGSLDVLILPDKDSKPSLNIFEYATYRYKNAAYYEGKIRPKPLNSASISQVTNVAKAQ